MPVKKGPQKVRDRMNRGVKYGRKQPKKPAGQLKEATAKTLGYSKVKVMTAKAYDTAVGTSKYKARQAKRKSLLARARKKAAGKD